jgi:hypothetical protein
MLQQLFISLILSVVITCGNYLPHEHVHAHDAEDYSVLQCEQCLHVTHYDATLIDIRYLQNIAHKFTSYKSITHYQNSRYEHSVLIRAPPFQHTLSA